MSAEEKDRADADHRSKVFRTKIVLIVLFFTVTTALLLFQRAIDDFASRQLAYSYSVVTSGYLTSYTYQTPGFHAFAATTMLITGLGPQQLLYLPMQLIPYMLLFFCIMRRLTKSAIFASLIISADVLSGVSGTFRVYLWPHGLGIILFFMLILIISSLLDVNFKRPKTALLAIFIVAEVSLVLMSYDYTAIYLIFIAITLLFALMFWRSPRIQARRVLSPSPSSGTLFSLFLIVTIAELGLSSFFYATFVPLMSDLNFIEVGGIDKIILAYFSSTPVNPALEPLYISYPAEITMIGLFKYILLVAVMLITGLTIIRSAIRKRKMPVWDLIVIVLGFTIILYCVPRVLIGDIPILLLYLPAIFSIAWLYGRGKGKHTKAFAMFVFFIMVLTIPIYYEMNVSNNLLNNTDVGNGEIVQATRWYDAYANEYSVSSDTFTASAMMVYADEREYDRLNIMDLAEVQFLVQKGPEPDAGSIFVLNNDLNKVDVTNWVTLKPWSASAAPIETNMQLSHIYNGQHISMYVQS